MSWFTSLFTMAFPFVADVAETRDVKASGQKLFTGLADRLRAVANSPAKVRELAEVIEQKHGELTGVIVAKTPAAKFMDADYMPPGSVDHDANDASDANRTDRPEVQPQAPGAPQPFGTQAGEPPPSRR